MQMATNKRILLHVCCGPCSTASIERLLSEGWEPTMFFSDSNIYPSEEFEKRYENAIIVARHYNLPIIYDQQDHDAWRAAVKGHEMDAEHGERCTLCFDYNLKRTAEKARELGFEYFTTTLTVSRFKKSSVIFAVGSEFPGFVEIDFKKKDGFAKSIRLSKELGLYRQDYCGCEFSLRDRIKQKEDAEGK